jgi:hypothetical protein
MTDGGGWANQASQQKLNAQLTRTRALLPARRAVFTYRVSASRNSLSCPAFKSISYSVPSSPNRMVPSAARPSRSSMSRICILGHGRPGSCHWLLSAR